MLPLLVAGCSTEPAEQPATQEGVSSAAPGATCSPAPELVADPTPSAPVALPAGAVLTDVTEQAGQRLVSGRVALSVGEVLAHFRADPAYVVTRDEDEGRSGTLQLFGARGDVGITVADLTCPAGLTGFTIATARAAVTQPSPVG